MPPLILGVTGAIATGKSLVCQTLVDLGAVHCDADKLVHRLYDPGTPGFERVVAAFGPDIVGTDGYIDRTILGTKVFGRPEEMRRLTVASSASVPGTPALRLPTLSSATTARCRKSSVPSSASAGASGT